MKIGVIGLGFVGLSLAAVLGSKGYCVMGIDSNEKKIAMIKSGTVPFYEPKLPQVISKALKKTLTVSSNLKEVIEKCDVVFITVGTPLSPKGKIDLENIQKVSKKIGEYLRNTSNKPTVVIKSTVVPGTTQDVIKPIIEKSSKKREGTDFNLLTNPEFLREGSAVEDTLKPHIIVAGGNDRKGHLKKLYKSLYNTKTPYISTNSQTAELIKYANNSFLATKISFINQIANICDSIEGANVDDVAKAIGHDPRIGSLFLKAGPGYGGSCLPKDLQALIAFSENIGQKPLLLKGVQKTNVDQVIRLTNFIDEVTGKNKKISILGLSFKEDSDDIRESVSIKLIKSLLKNKYQISVHDPKAIENTKEIFGNKISYSKTIADALRESYCAIIMTPWSQYRKLKNSDIELMKNKTIIDTRRILEKSNLKIKYYGIGKKNF
jgi:UDPglucose 6-dehydrogenase